MKEPSDHEETGSVLADKNLEIFPTHHSAVTRFLFARKPEPVPQNPQISPEFKANIFSRLIWSWLSPLTYKGYNRSLQFNDIYELDEKHQMQTYVRKINQKAEINIKNNSHSPHWRAILSSVKWVLIRGASLHLISYTATLGQTVVANRLIKLIEQIYNGDHSVYGQAVGYAVGELLLLTCFLMAFLHSNYQMEKLMELVRIILNVLIYEKTMRLSSCGKAQYTTSAITSLLTTDVARITMASRLLMFPITDTLIICAVIGLLIYYLGVSALAGIGLIVAGLVLLGTSGKFISKYRKASLPHADKRTGIVRDTISSMRTLKLYGWEDSFVQMIGASRQCEEEKILLISRITQIVITGTQIIPFVAGLVTFSVMSSIGRDLDPSLVFPSLSLFQMIAPLTEDLSRAIVTLADSYECFKRIELFMSADEGHSSVDHIDGAAEMGEPAIKFENASFKWLKELPSKTQLTFSQRLLAMLDLTSAASLGSLDEKLAAEICCVSGFDNLDLEIKQGELIVVVGSIGSGKSNLLKAIAGQMAKTSGSLTVAGSLTEVLDNWCLNATVRDNILFGKPYDPELYATTLKACEMHHDLQLLESGDMTEIGEHGVTLSGGQRARLALARGFYNAQDIVLLDDILSAVDSKVGKNIMDNCIAGALAGKTRIFATHNPAHFTYANRIIFVKKGEKPRIRLLEELRQDPDFLDYLEGGVPIKASTAADTSSENATEQEQVQEAKATEKLMEEEMRSHGTVDFDVIKSYIKFTSKHPLANSVAVIVLVAAIGASFAMQSVFLNWWSADHFGRANGFYIGIYAAIIASMAASQIAMIVLVSGLVFRGTSNLHNAAIANIYRAPLSFFDTNPIGRIINRFTNDLATLDTSWVFLVTLILPFMANMISSYVLIFVYVPWAILCVIPLFIVGSMVLSYYRYSSREINRIVSLLRGKLLSAITENIDGSSVVLGYGRRDYFLAKVFEYGNKALSSAVLNRASMNWFAVRVILSFLPLNFVVVMLCVSHVFHVSPSVAGMLLSLLPNAGIMLCQVMIVGVEVEKSLNSVERLYEYAFKLPQEPAHVLTPEPTPEEWPSQGAIKFDHVSMRYRQELPLVLRDLELDVLPGEKIGVCGRTGAGKSSLLACLFRLNEIEAGTIFIDNIDISTMGLRKLRNSLSIIPQEPVLFHGTVRSNLDPFGVHTDADLWSALKRSGSALGLDDSVDQQGANFSLGERQLLTLGRALVRQSKLLALDEATANVDHKTDSKIQKVLAKEFAHCTVICIAHRLQTILSYDRIVVMDSGRVAELGTPLELYLKGGIFASLCNESGIGRDEIAKFK